MGTHPIFESDFDCLTDMRATGLLRGGSNWASVPPEKCPSPRFWQKVIPGTPYAVAQAQLHQRGLHDPWMRNIVYQYDNNMRQPYPMVSVANDDLIKRAFFVVLGILFIEEVCGIIIFGDNHVAPTADDMTAGLPGLTAATGDEHTRYFRGQSIHDMRFV